MINPEDMSIMSAIIIIFAGITWFIEDGKFWAGVDEPTHQSQSNKKGSKWHYMNINVQTKNVK